MIKYWILVVALLLSALAYADPSATLSVQIIPHGVSSGAPAPPSPAIAANFDTCVVCIDFTAVSGGVFVNGAAVAGANGATPSTWLDCAGASSPIWFQGSNGNTNRSINGNIEPCPDVTSDGLGNSHVLHMQTPPLCCTNQNWDINGMKLYNNDAGVGIMAPTNNYMEATYIVPQFPHSGYIMGPWLGGAGEIPSGVHNNLEFDAWEINTDINPGAHASCMGSWYGGNQGLGCNWFSTFPPNYDSFNPTTQYLKVAQRMTSDGNTIFKCMWINDAFQNCISATVNGGSLQSFSLTDSRSRMQTYFDLTGGLQLDPGGTTSTMHAYTKSFNMWACSGWQTLACNTSAADPGGY